MVTYLLLTVFLLSVLLIALLIKIILMKKSAKEIENSFKEKLNIDTNTLIDISSNDKDMRSLATSINSQLRILREERHRFRQGDTELKTAVTNISHDLRTPLTAISGYLDLLEHEEKSKEVERYLDIIKNRTETLKQLTEELFRYSVITSPENKITIKQTDIKAALEESIVGFYAALQERKILPDINMPETKVIAGADKDALSRVFANLINNAIKYSDGDLTITLTESCKITFENTASQLTEVQVEQLFDRFFTVENARKSTGLGLSISRILIEQMGGTISATLKNKRLIICITLPKS